MAKQFPFELAFGDYDALAMDSLWPNGGDTFIFGGSDLPQNAGEPVANPGFFGEARFDVPPHSSGPGPFVAPAEAYHAPANPGAEATEPVSAMGGPPVPAQDNSGVTPGGTVAVAV